MAKTADPTPSAAGVPMPAAMEATGFKVEGNEYLILSYPVPRWNVPEVLSPAEELIARRLLAGESCAEIARSRGTAARTVANQIASIFAKLKVKSRLELAAKCAATPASKSQRGSE
jgi:DNA-binding CsgD family transcriptional regulator